MIYRSGQTNLITMPLLHNHFVLFDEITFNLFNLKSRVNENAFMHEIQDIILKYKSFPTV